MRYDMRLSSSCQEGIAAKNEIVVFHVVLRDSENGNTRAEKGVVRWILTRNVWNVTASGILDLSTHFSYVSCCPDRSGYYACEFIFEGDGERIVKHIGFLCEPEKIRPSLEVPGDFDAYWDARKRELKSVPIRRELHSVFRDELFDVAEISCPMVGESPARGVLTRPLGGRKKLPLLIAFQGAGVRSAGCELCSMSREVLFLEVNAHGLESFRDPEFYKKAPPFADYAGKIFFPTEDPRDSYLNNMFMRDLRMLEAAMTLPEWDGKNLIVTGASQGAWQSFAMAALCGKVTAAAVSIPAGADIYAGGWPGRHNPAERSPELEARLRRVSPYFDSCSMASRVGNIPFHVNCGLADCVCKADGVMAAYNMLKSPEKKLNLLIKSGHEPSDPSDRLDAKFISGTFL